jgi:hypothetical protein
MGFDRRGIVLAPEDLRGMVKIWLDWMAAADLNVLGLHAGVDGLRAFVASDEGKVCLRGAERRAIAVEYEIHALASLLPRALFSERPGWFRMDEHGQRTADANLCSSNDAALEHVGRAAVHVAQALSSATNRYYFWADDAKPWCFCPQCREFAPSDQNVRVMNAIAQHVGRAIPDARIAYLAYWNTLEPPSRVAPSRSLFLEYAPIRRNSSRPLDDPGDAANREHAEGLRRLVRAFPMEGAQVLEYWMDASRFSRWRRPSVKVPFDRDVLERDARFYAQLGFRSATSFGVFLDADYVRMHGVPPIRDYGQALAAA